MLKAYPEAISLGGRLILAGILASLGINNNRIISGIYNCIPVPSKLRYVVEKSRQATFMSIAGFVCNYLCSMSRNKGECAGIDHLVKYITLWDGERVQSIWLYVDASKGIPE